MLLLCLLFCCRLQAAGPCVVTGLRCEYLVDPLGIDAPAPRLSWRLADERRGAKQLAYQVLVSVSSTDFTSPQNLVWDSRKINAATTLVRYGGRALQPFTTYYWKVVALDKDGVPATAAPVARFETGMMGVQNWKGTWISDGAAIDVKPAPYFRKTFGIARKVKSARAFVAAAGLYELSLNGERVGNNRLDPAYTRFDRRLLYVTHDVTKQLQQGTNAIGVLLGNGWYNHQSTAVWNFHNAPWRARPAFCLDLRITYEDGSTETVSSGKDWKTSDGPVRFNSIYTGEHYDASFRQPLWNTAGFVDTAWKTVLIRSAPATNIVSQVMHPIRNVATIAAVSLTRINDTTYLYNFGRNISGVSKIKVQGPKGTVLFLKHGERLNKMGRLDQSNIDAHYRPADDTDPFQTDILTLSGNGVDSFMPAFNYKGFQYVEVSSSRPVQLKQEDLVAYFMHSDVPAVGEVHAANSMINKLWQATNNSYLSNLFGYPTDCPQREKNGWTGDAHIALETGLYNFDGITVYEKWLADHRDEQQPNGVLPSIIPTGGWGYEWGNGPDWTSTIAIIPWTVYQFYGDPALLQSNYVHIKRYVDHINELYPTGLTTWGLGDWVPVKTKSPVEFTSSIYYYTDTHILSEAARILGKEEDARFYTALAQKIRDAINAKYLDRSTALYGNGAQTELSAPLYWNIVPSELRSKVAANLARRVQQDGLHLDVGLLGTKSILNALSENGYADLAYQVAAQETYPSWGWWIRNGATTLYENWDIDAKSDISLNHIMFGEVGAWLYKALGGIKPDDTRPGFSHLQLQPHFVAGLDSFAAQHHSPHGLIASSWKKKGNTIEYDVTVPPNTTATLVLAEGAKQLYENGRQVKAIRFKQAGAGQPGAQTGYPLTSGSYHFIVK
ncbi:alpha-L-rhamnosidase [Cnuella takakiae]|uniref:alpha-L-rhamnosidase n=1 Tax=Cnuella takakiae TaxID=1302690 RepID=A0A1M4SZH8_9BACT|nr:alpha-L-rhamnosidase [Cnuella takakiae]OLY90640.1 alpha-rhamnosidase [Cnuella takakiae]SHE37626.1 alpha-L-rhamnosidase [Cnuella takakiae]